MDAKGRQETPKPRIGTYLWTLALAWSVMVGASLWWNLHSNQQGALMSARTQARIAFEKDVIYRRWNAQHGGVYAAVNSTTKPNPYLKIPEREIKTPGGTLLTKINPAYMTRQAHELGALSSGVLGHITSLKPLRPQNMPDAWERKALQQLEQGVPEVSGVETLNGNEYLRLMKPLVTEPVCLPCHAAQGYKVGDIRGGISVSVPWQPIMAAIYKEDKELSITHASLWLVVMLGLILGARNLNRRINERDLALEERRQALQESLNAKEKVKRLEGLLPICSSCKRIRDDNGEWQAMEAYIHSHSEADFTHGICPECARKLYPELVPPKK
jgi:hypothetical protein